MKRPVLILLAGAGVAAYAVAGGPAAPFRAQPPAPAAFSLPPVIIDGPATVGAQAGPSAPDAIDTSYLWAAFEAGDYASVRAEVAALARVEPGWTPPSDLMLYTDAAESRAAVLGALAQGAPGQAVAYYDAHPERFACADVTIEALWGVAEAHVALGRPADAFAIYSRAVDECEAPDLRLASLEKAIALQDPARFRALIAIEDERSAELTDRARLERIRRDALGGGEGPVEPPKPYVPTRFDRVLADVGARRASPADLAWLEAETLRSGNGNAAMVIGWQRLDAGQPAEARAWFERALARRRSAKALEGLWRSLGAMGDRAGQARLAAENPAALGRIAAAETAGAGATPSRLAPAWAALEAGDPAAALAIAGAVAAPADEKALLTGWALMRRDSPAEAQAAFDAAALSPSPETRASASQGRALSAIARGADPSAQDVGTLDPKARAAVELAAYDRAMAEAHRAGRKAEALSALRDRAARFPGAAEPGEIAGWILFENGQPNAAATVFRRIAAQTRSESAYAALETVSRYMYGE
jgi:tetratricopeptide (TPR) repeat protein